MASTEIALPGSTRLGRGRPWLRLPRALRAPWLVGFVVSAFVFLYLPLLMTAFFSFTVGHTTRFPIHGFTLNAYNQVLRESTIVAGVENSVYVAVGAMLLATLLAVPAALATARRQSGRRSPVTALLLLPLVVPTLIQGIALLTFFSFLKVELSLSTVVLAHALYTSPVVFLVVRARLLEIDPFIHEAARDLGAAPFTVFRRVTLPLIRSSILGSMVLAFALSFDEFVLAFFTIGPQNTLPLVIFSELRTGLDLPGLSALVTMLVTATGIVLLFTSRFARVQLD
jgi:spermidine/putrescine transport system permease protein